MKKRKGKNKKVSISNSIEKTKKSKLVKTLFIAVFLLLLIWCFLSGFQLISDSYTLCMNTLLVESNSNSKEVVSVLQDDTIALSDGTYVNNEISSIYIRVIPETKMSYIEDVGVAIEVTLIEYMQMSMMYIALSLVCFAYVLRLLQGEYSNKLKVLLNIIYILFSIYDVVVMSVYAMGYSNYDYISYIIVGVVIILAFIRLWILSCFKKFYVSKKVSKK